jgi:hypothetical protein
MKQIKFKMTFFLWAFIALSACSNDGGDGKDDKGEKQNSVAPASGLIALSACESANPFEAALHKLREQCYQTILANEPTLLNELQGQNPFLIETWDRLKLEQISFASQVLNCRISFAERCE